MIIRSNRHVNLHSKSFSHTRADQHGLIHVPADTTVRVPDDVQDHPGFQMLVDGGVVTIHGKKRKRPTDEEIQAARSQSELKGEERPILPLQDDDPPLQPSSNTSQIPTAQSAGPDDGSQSTQPAPAPAPQEAPSLIPPAEEVDVDEDEDEDEDEEDKEESTEK